MSKKKKEERANRECSCCINVLKEATIIFLNESRSHLLTSIESCEI